MKYGDAVLYVRDRQALNALVAQSFQTEDGEVLNLIYLDPDASALGNQRMANFVQSAFSVKPLGPGMSFGWSPVPLDIVKEPPLSAPEQLDAVQGPATPGDPASPHAIEPVMPTDLTSLASVEDAKATALAAQINANLGK